MFFIIKNNRNFLFLYNLKCYVVKLFKVFSDDRIIQGIKSQDTEVLNWLYDHYFPDVRRFVLRNSGTQDDAYDVFQEAIIVLYNQIKCDELEYRTDIKSYFLGIGKIMWRNKLSHTKTYEQLEDNILSESDVDVFNDPAFVNLVQRSLKKLTNEECEVLNMFAQGMSYKDIADIMGYSSEVYARRKKYLSKERLIAIIKSDPEFSDFYSD